MEILIPVAVSAMTSLVKWAVTKLGDEMGKNAILAVVFVLSLSGAILYEKGIVTLDLVQSWVSIGLIAVGWYKVVVEMVIMPAFEKVKNLF